MRENSWSAVWQPANASALVMPQPARHSAMVYLDMSREELLIASCGEMDRGERYESMRCTAFAKGRECQKEGRS